MLGKEGRKNFMQGKMMQKALLDTKVSPREQADNPLSREETSKRI